MTKFQELDTNEDDFELFSGDENEINNDETNEENNEENKAWFPPKLLSSHIKNYTINENHSPNNLLKKIENIFDLKFTPERNDNVTGPDVDKPCDKFHEFHYSDTEEIAKVKMAIVQQGETFFIFQFEHTHETISWNSTAIGYYFDLEDSYKKEHPYWHIFNYVSTILITSLRFNFPKLSATADLAKLAVNLGLPQYFGVNMEFLQNAMTNGNMNTSQIMGLNATQIGNAISLSDIATRSLNIANNAVSMLNQEKSPFNAGVDISNDVYGIGLSGEMMALTFLAEEAGYTPFPSLTRNNIEKWVQNNFTRFLPSRIKNKYDLEHSLTLLMSSNDAIINQQTSSDGSYYQRLNNWVFGSSIQPHIANDVRQALLNLTQLALDYKLDIDNPLDYERIHSELQKLRNGPNIFGTIDPLESASRRWEQFKNMKYPLRYDTPGDRFLNFHMTGDRSYFGLSYTDIIFLSPILLKYIDEDQLQQILYSMRPPLLQWNAAESKIPMSKETWETLANLRRIEISKLKVAQHCLLRSPLDRSIFTNTMADYSWIKFVKSKTPIKYNLTGFIETINLQLGKGILENLLHNWRKIISAENVSQNTINAYEQQLEFVNEFMNIKDDFVTERFIVIIGEDTCRTVEKLGGENKFITSYTALKVKYPLSPGDITVDSSLQDFTFTPDQKNNLTQANINPDNIEKYEKAVQNFANGDYSDNNVDTINSGDGQRISDILLGTRDSRIMDLRNATLNIPTGNNKKVMDAMKTYLSNPTAQNLEEVNRYNNGLNDEFQSVINDFFIWNSSKESQEMIENLEYIQHFIRFPWGQDIFVFYNTTHLLWKLFGNRVSKRIIDIYTFNSALSNFSNANNGRIQNGIEYVALGARIANNANIAYNMLPTNQ